MAIDSARCDRATLRTLAAAGAIAFLLTGCGKDSPPPAAQAPAPAAPAAPQPTPQAQAAPAPALAAAPAPAREQEDKPDPDKALAASVRDALRAALGTLADNIDVTASGGKVTLWGTVPEVGKRRQAVRAATGVAGVKSVRDNMAIVAGS